MVAPHTSDKAQAHCVHRQTIELRVASGVQASEIYAELTDGFRERLSFVLDETFDAACDRNTTLRIDRIELDLGVVPRQQLPQLLAQRARERLASILASVSASTSAAESPSPHDAATVLRLTASELAIERIASFLASGALMARDGRWSRENMAAELVGLLDDAPQALANRLRGLPPGPTAHRLARHFSTDIAARVAALLGGVAPAAFEAVVDECLFVVAACADADHRPAGRGTPAQRAHVIEDLLEAILREGALHGALRHFSDHLANGGFARAEGMVRGKAALHRAAIAMLVDAVSNVLPSASPVRRAIERVLRDQGLDHESGTAGAGTTTKPGSSAPAQAALERCSPAEPGAGPMAAPSGREDSITQDRLRAASAQTPAPEDDDPTGLRGTSAQQRRALLLREPEVAAPSNLSPAQDTFHVDDAGLVILWPFLSGFFQKLGLAVDRRFADETARSRAVLLTAHLCDGADDWAEHELLTGKLLCGYALFDPIATRLELSDAERDESRALLEAVSGHWPILKKLSIGGLRNAFLRREGTLSRQQQGWKLEVARAGHDVLLDKLPWGFGLVLLPWMQEPLYVEW